MRTSRSNGHKNGNGWHMDRRVPISFVIALIVQTAGGVWWAASLSSNVAASQTEIVRLKDRNDRLVVVETQLQHVNETLKRLEQAIARLDRQPRR